MAIKEFDRIVLGRIDEIERKNGKWTVRSAEVAQFPVVFGTSYVAIEAVEASFRRLADAKLIDSMGGSDLLPAAKQPYGLTPAGIANSIPTAAVLAELSDDEIDTRLRAAARVESVRNPYLVEQESRHRNVTPR